MSSDLRMGSKKLLPDEFLNIGFKDEEVEIEISNCKKKKTTKDSNVREMQELYKILTYISMV